MTDLTRARRNAPDGLADSSEAFPTVTGLMASLVEAVAEARKQAELAYQFSPGSYTYSTFIAAAKAASILGVPDDDEGEQ